MRANEFIARSTESDIKLKFNTTMLENYTDICKHANRLYKDNGIDDKNIMHCISNIRQLLSEKFRLTESTDYNDIQQFEQAIDRLSTKATVNVGDMFSALVFEIQYMNSYIEVYGFTEPQKVTKIMTEPNGYIRYILFENGDQFPRVPFKTGKKGMNLEHPAFFNTTLEAEKALTYLTMMLPETWEMNTSALDNGPKIEEDMMTGGSLGLPFPGTYEQEYNKFKTRGPRRITAMTNEALDSSYPYAGNAIGGRYHFETEDGIFYKVYFAGNDLVEVAFSAILPGEEENFRPNKTTITGTGNSRKVFGTVINIVKEYLDFHQPTALYFTGEKDEPSRIKLYDALIAQVDKALPEYYAEKSLDLGSGKAYMLRRKEDTITEALDSSYPYEFKNNGYYFTTDEGNDYKVMFNGTKKVEVSFVTRDKSGQVKDTITGSGDSRKVFGTVIDIVKDYVSQHNPEILMFAAVNSEPSRVRLYNMLASQAGKALPGYNFAKTLKNRMLTSFYLTHDNIKVPKLDTAKNTVHRVLDTVFENIGQTITLDDLYDGSYPDDDEMIWNHVGQMDFDIPFTVRNIRPLELDELLCDNYGVDDVNQLFRKMQPEQEAIVSDYQNDPNLSQQIIVLADRQIIDGNHRALAAVLANKPIKYIDVTEETL